MLLLSESSPEARRMRILKLTLARFLIGAPVALFLIIYVIRWRDLNNEEKEPKEEKIYSLERRHEKENTVAKLCE